VEKKEGKKTGCFRQFEKPYLYHNNINMADSASLYIDCRRPRFWRWLRIMAVFVAVLFLWQQITWAQGGQPLQVTKSEGQRLPGHGLNDLSIPKDKAITKTSYINGSDEVIITL